MISVTRRTLACTRFKKLQNEPSLKSCALKISQYKVCLMANVVATVYSYLNYVGMYYTVSCVTIRAGRYLSILVIPYHGVGMK